MRATRTQPDRSKSPRSLASRQGLIKNVLLVVAFSLLVTLLAQIAIKLPFTVVPITGQTLGVLLAGGALGANRGAASLALYALWGVIGIPVFAPQLADGVTFHFILPWEGTGEPFWNLASGGYIVGFIFAAWVVGRLAEGGFTSRVSAMLAGNIVLYVPGLLWLMYDLEIGWGKALEWGLYPFIIGDLIKLYAAAIALPGAWALVGRKGR